MAQQHDFEIDLFAGGNDSGYHIQDLPGQKQRDHLVQYGYGSSRIVKGRLVDVIHGRLSPTGPPASLVVCTIKFLGSTPSKRFRSARITWDFAYADAHGDDGDGDDDGPEVYRISLDDQFVMKQSTVDKSTETSVEAGVQGGGGPAGLSLSTVWSRAHAVTIDDHISLYGSSVFTRKNVGEPNGAKWILEENRSQNSGIPGSLTTAVLLKRKNDRKFVGTIQIGAKMGVAAKVEDLFGRKPKVDPVVFDPALPPTSKDYDPLNLDKVVLDDIGVVKLHTSMEA